ncbi:uncharacterized protein METZ01_LOCUS165873 [marine metagenome]|uniref:Uncharacterized protein n=1 Tax=marine metagenome TaxID=408172 RepID=A0A382BHD0_9ZZZZ
MVRTKNFKNVWSIDLYHLSVLQLVNIIMETIQKNQHVF